MFHPQFKVIIKYVNALFIKKKSLFETICQFSDSKFLF